MMRFLAQFKRKYGHKVTLIEIDDWEDQATDGIIDEVYSWDGKRPRAFDR